jgi:ribulose-5-phosphate 4-epimerase/fuculose-1-phosphate aldolase
MPVPMSLSEAREMLARANRMIANEGVLDAFGHVTLRHPSDPKRYLMARSLAPELVQPEDIHEFTLDSEIVRPIKQRLYSERVIHGEIYKARPDVTAVCHHHAPSMLPFCVTGITMKPLNHLGATMGAKVPVWDSRDEFGNTNLLVAKPAEGASLARALGPHWTVLMRRHGATVAGRTLEELTFRTIYAARNAAVQIQAELLGAGLEPLNAEEIELAASFNLGPGPCGRAWEYWSMRLDKVEGNWRAPATRAAANKPAAKRKAAVKTTTEKKRSKRRR